MSAMMAASLSPSARVLLSTKFFPPGVGIMTTLKNPYRAEIQTESQIMWDPNYQVNETK